MIGILIAGIGLTIGITWATKTWKKTGTMQFLSRIDATPELDNRDVKITENKVEK